MLRLNNIKIREDLSDYEVLKLSIKKYKIDESDITKWFISKKSIDARKKDDVHYNYSIDLNVKNEKKYPRIDKVKEVTFPNIKSIKKTLSKPVVIVGAGPAGLFCALTLVESGISPIIIEQGETVENRKDTVDKFLKEGKLRPSSNVQFGEGGAGTFSDGKLTTGINSPFCKKVLQDFVKFGAPKEILYISKPHIGTDNLINIIKNIREYLISKGCIFYFNSKAIDFRIADNKIQSVIIENTSLNTLQNTSSKTFEIETSNLILAIGHSSRDTFEKLYNSGFQMEKKNFSIGVRIEHLQKWINNSQYGNITKLKLPPAEYKLAYHSPTLNRSCYTFCMCPGGVVIASSSNSKEIVTNGMSNYLRNGTNSNSALLVNVVPEDFNNPSPLAGIYFQKDLEEKAFILGGSNYFAPIQRVEDFLNNKKSTFIGKVQPTYKPGTTLSNLNSILPTFVSKTLAEGIKYFGTKIQGFDNPDSILTGLETRSSSPVRILRNNTLQSNIHGVYPCGEGARICRTVLCQQQ